MNNLIDVRNELIKGGVDVESFTGHTLVCSIGVFMLDSGTILHNGSPITNKEFAKLIQPLTNENE